MAIFVRIAAFIHTLCVPFQVAFLGPACTGSGELGGFATVYILCEFPLWIRCLVGMPLRYRRHGCLSVGSVLYDGIVLLCCLPWDAMAGSAGDAELGWCFSYGHLTRCFFVLELTRALTRAFDRVLPGLGSERATASFLQLGLHSVITMHWFACLTYMAPLLTEEPELTWVVTSGLDDRPLWARYVRSFDRGLLVFLGEGVRGETDAEVLVALLGLLLGLSLIHI